MRIGKNVVDHNGNGTIISSYEGIEIGGRLGAIIGMVLSIPMVLIGVILILLTAFSYYSDFKHNNFIETTATIMEINTNEDVNGYKISYLVDNHTYISDITSGMIEQNVGDSFSIRYNPDNPNDISWSDSSTSWIFPFISLFVMFCGISAFIHHFKKFKNLKSVPNSSGVSFGYGEKIPTESIPMTNIFPEEDATYTEF